MMKYKMIPANKKYDWVKTLAYFTTLYIMQRTYSEDRASESGSESVTNITHIALATSIGHVTTNLNRGGAIEMTEDEATTAYHDYVKGLEETLPDTKE